MVRRRIAVFTGAGASASFGYPVTSQILPRVRDAVKKDLFLDYDDWFENPAYLRRAQADLRIFLRELFPGLDKVKDGLPLITDLISMVDHAINTSSSIIKGRTVADMAWFRTLLEWATIDTLLWADEVTTSQEKLQHAVVDRIVELIDADVDIALISTNYDDSIERKVIARVASDGKSDGFSWDLVASGIDFGVSWRNPEEEDQVIYARPEPARFRLYKLHGSIQALRCDICEYTYFNPDGNISHWAFDPEKHEFNTCHCGHFPLRSLITAPSFTRGGYNSTLQSIWKAALDFLSTADKWYIVGYSLPSEDVAIRTLLAKAYQNAQSTPEIDVIQLTNDAEARYTVHFPNVTYHKGGLAAFDLAKLE